MFDVSFSQISGAVAGGVVGGCAGFIANHLQQRQERSRERRNVASALIGEVGALAQLIGHSELIRIQSGPSGGGSETYPFQYFRGERDYMPVFRGLGASVGVLPSPLSRDLVAWYARLAICLERTHELHELSLGGRQDLGVYIAELAKIQLTEFSQLVGDAQPLLSRLSVV
jgi:hypothetical protein